MSLSSFTQISSRLIAAATLILAANLSAEPTLQVPVEPVDPLQVPIDDVEVPQLAAYDSQTDYQADSPLAKMSQLPVGALQLSAENAHILWAETKSGKLHLLERDQQGGLKPIKSMNMSIGKAGYGKEVEGDKRTPIGVYRFTSFLSDEQLTDFYGLGAYPIDYPNAHDKRLKRTGHGIWLHGFPKGVDSRPSRDSDGCVVIHNDELTEMASYIETGETYLIISEHLQWQPIDQAQQQLRPVEQAFNQWLSAWQTIDNDRYLGFYDETFTNLKKDKTQWENYKRRIHKNKRFIDVSISDLSIFEYPGETDLISLRYFQSYKSSNYRWAGWKEQLWGLRDGQWKIIYEGDA